MDLIRFKRYTIDNKTLVTEINALTREIDEKTKKREQLMARLKNFESAMAMLNGVAESKKPIEHTAKKVVKVGKSAKAPPIKNKPKGNHWGNNRFKNTNAELITKTKELIISTMTDEPVMPKKLFEKLYETPDFNWPLSGSYLDAVVRNLANDGKIKRIPLGYMKA